MDSLDIVEFMLELEFGVAVTIGAAGTFESHSTPGAVWRAVVGARTGVTHKVCHLQATQHGFGFANWRQSTGT